MRTLLKLALSIGISFAILAIVLQLVTSGLPQQDRPSVLLALQNTSLKLVAGFIAVYLVTLLVRAYRYRLLITLSGETNVPNLRQMALVTGIRNMVVDMLPARLGELGYIGLLNNGYGVKLQHCASSLAISIAFDFIALLVVVLLIIAKQLITGSAEGWVFGALLSAIALSAIALAGLFLLLPWVAETIRKSQRELFQFSNEDSWRAKLFKLFSAFVESLITVRQSGKTMLICSVSILIRLLKYLSFYLLFMAVALPSFNSLAELPAEQIISALIGGEIGSSLPIPTFMSFGSYEAGGALVVHLLQIADKASAFVTLLSVHIWSQFMEYILGGVLLAVFILMRRSPVKSSFRDNRLATSLLAITSAVILLGGSFFLAWELRAAKKMGAVSPPEAGQAVDLENNEWRALSKHALSEVDGFVVWSSNRNGNHDILKLSLPDFTITSITNHPHTEYFPRLSPDGQKMIFSRSQQPWVSQRNIIAWDLYLLDLQSNQETLLATNSTYGNWTSNSEVTFLNNGNAVDKMNIATRQRQRIYESGVNNAIPKGTKIHTPELNPVTGQLLFTSLQSKIGLHTGHWGTAILDGDQHRGVYNGCEIAWSFDGRTIYQVSSGGEMGTQLVQIDPSSFKATPWIDLVGEFSREYWPKDSSNGQYVVFGASRGDHEHDQADYELFLWKTGSNLNKAHRLTFHTGNDNWPDVHINHE